MASRPIMEYRTLEIAGGKRFAEELNALVDCYHWRPVHFDTYRHYPPEFEGGWSTRGPVTVYVAVLERPRTR